MERRKKGMKEGGREGAAHSSSAARKLARPGSEGMGGREKGREVAWWV